MCIVTLPALRARTFSLDFESDAKHWAFKLLMKIIERLWKKFAFADFFTSYRIIIYISVVSVRFRSLRLKIK